MNLIKLNIGDKVFEPIEKLEGEILEINNNTATVLLSNGVKVFSHITNLVKLNNTSSNTVQQFNPTQDSRQFNLVKEFHEAFNHPVSDKPTLISKERGLNRSVWTGEEIVEFLHSLSSNEVEFDKLYQKFIEGLQKAYRKSYSQPYLQDDTERIVALSDALTDASYFINGTFVELGVQPQSLFEIVQESNMSKLFTDENGNKYVKNREDGKILKSPEFFPPEEKLKEEIIRQLG